MSIIKIIVLALLGIFIVIQFFRPEPNSTPGLPEHAIGARYPVPPEVQKILQRSCFDCHSNTTAYPWYAQIQPVGWWLGDHIRQGKGELNFDEFASYRLMKQYRKFEAIREQVEEDLMPFPAYTIVHRSAILSPEDKEKIISWVEAMRDTMKQRYPADSLQRRPRTQENHLQ